MFKFIQIIVLCSCILSKPEKVVNSIGQSLISADLTFTNKYVVFHNDKDMSRKSAVEYVLPMLKIKSSSVNVRFIFLFSAIY